jgi:hypothetical protein
VLDIYRRLALGDDEAEHDGDAANAGCGCCTELLHALRVSMVRVSRQRLVRTSKTHKKKLVTKPQAYAFNAGEVNTPVMT